MKINLCSERPGFDDKSRKVEGHERSKKVLPNIRLTFQVRKFMVGGVACRIIFLTA